MTIAMKVQVSCLAKNIPPQVSVSVLKSLTLCFGTNLPQPPMGLAKYTLSSLSALPTNSALWFIYRWFHREDCEELVLFSPNTEIPKLNYGDVFKNLC